MSQPFLSIVTICFNQAQYLRQCLDSVVSQKCEAVEYIVVDPGSTDGSRAILESYGEAIDYLILEPDNGPADGLNKGFARARGEVGYFINSDDFLLPGAIKRMRRLWRTHPRSDAIAAAAWIVDEESNPVLEVQPTPLTLDVLVGGGGAVVQHGFTFKMETFRTVGGFNSANRTCWDYELICAMIGTGAKIQVVSDRLGVFRLHGGSLSGGGHGARHEVQYAADLARIYGRYTDRIPAKPASGKLTSIVKHIKNPTWSVTHLRNRYDLRRRRMRWDNDMSPCVDKA